MEFLTIKDIAKIMKVSQRTAERYNADIKKHFNLTTRITLSHLKAYLRIP